jgi:hypothetical protein
MWGCMQIATPVRIAKWQDQLRPLDAAERQQIFDGLTTWYYQSGHGMLLEGTTRSLYLAVKDNLICPVEEFKPKAVRERLLRQPVECQEWERGIVLIQQLSTLRTRMKADLDVYGPTYHTDADHQSREDRIALLKCCSENPDGRPWEEPWYWRLRQRIAGNNNHRAMAPYDRHAPQHETVLRR